jgi:hypothetical protein
MDGDTPADLRPRGEAEEVQFGEAKLLATSAWPGGRRGGGSAAAAAHWPAARSAASAALSGGGALLARAWGGETAR